MKEVKTIVALAHEYIDHRHKLGSQILSHGRHVLEFAEYADKSGHRGPITTELALRWACLPQGRTPLNRARRLEVVRCFARYAAMFDEGTEIPPCRLLGPAHRRIQPHIYSDKEIGQLMKAAAELSPVGGLRPRTYVALFGLLASTGLRISEAVNLRRSDVDLKQGVLRILESKFRKSRLVVIHPTTRIQLQAYERFRDRYHYPARDPDAFFLSERGKSMNRHMAEHTFWGMSHRFGWNAAGGRSCPRLYDLRHTFACRRLLQWYREGVNIDHAIAALSTYMGHETLRDTYWYLTGIPELMAIATTRFECFAKQNHQEALS